jgi:hypothetical protein
MQTDFDRLVRRVEMIYGEQKQQPNIPALYIARSPASKATELDEARALILSFLREVPRLTLTLAAMLVILARHAWRWLRSWKRTPQGG